MTDKPQPIIDPFVTYRELAEAKLQIDLLTFERDEALALVDHLLDQVSEANV